MASEAGKRAKAKYDAENAVYVSLKLLRKPDADILDRLAAVGNRQGYIKDLIRQDIRKGREPE